MGKHFWTLDEHEITEYFKVGPFFKDSQINLGSHFALGYLVHKHDIHG